MQEPAHVAPSMKDGPKTTLQQRQAVIAGALFLAAAAAPAAVWYILFTVGIPEGKSVTTSAVEFLNYVFVESPDPSWPFLLLALLPFLFVALAVWQWSVRMARHRHARSVRLVAALVSLAALLAAWQAALFGFIALYYSHKSDA